MKNTQNRTFKRPSRIKIWYYLYDSYRKSPETILGDLITIPKFPCRITREIMSHFLKSIEESTFTKIILRLDSYLLRVHPGLSSPMSIMRVLVCILLETHED